MGAKLSKKGSKAGEGKAKEEMAEPALTTFDKTATLPASFRKRNVNQEPTVSVANCSIKLSSDSSHAFSQLVFCTREPALVLLTPFHVPSF